MFGYYLTLALYSLRRNPVLTVLMIIAIGVGIGASMTMLTILRAAGGDPIPQKAEQLFVPQIDNFGPQPNAPQQNQDGLPIFMTYTDALALMRAHAAARQAAMYEPTVSITPPGPKQNPIQGSARATYSDFFPMFDVPFKFGGPWGRSEDDAHASVVVLTRSFNDRLFGGANSIGRTLTIDDQPYRVIGVLDDWNPSPRFYDLGENSYSGADQLFLPFTRAIDEQMPNSEGIGCDRNGAGRGWDGLLHSNCIWVRFWVELPTRSAAARYLTFLHNYAAEQRQTGRFSWPTRVALRNVTQWLTYNHVVPVAVGTLTTVSFAILLVCLLNAAGLMLAKFMARGGGMGIRRALGANRPAIFAQCLVEAGVIGLIGGLVGISLTKFSLVSSRAVLPQDLSGLTRLHVPDVLIALAVAVVATLLAGLYPTWRATRVGSILSSLRRTKAGAALIALQIALTLAVLSNALFIIRQQTTQSRTPSGVADEASVFVINNRWIGQSGAVAAREQTDLAGLRALPQVADATVSYNHPLGGPRIGQYITLHPDDPKSKTIAMMYMVDDHAMNTLGLRLIAGRNFHADEIVNRDGVGDAAASLGGVIVTEALARALAPGGKVLGRTAVLLPDGTKAPIIGVVARLQSSPLFGDSPLAVRTMLLPYRWTAPPIFYMVRAKPGQVAAAMTAAQNELYQISRQRIIMGMQTLTDARRDSYRGDRGVAMIMGVVCAILLGVTAFGIVGLTSYWVAQRRRQIGIRRALGATRGIILRHVQVENLQIAAGGCILGVLLALAANLWILRSIALARLPSVYPVIGVIAMLVLGQLAVLWPALRAASVPPTVATRSS